MPECKKTIAIHEKERKSITECFQRSFPKEQALSTMKSGNFQMIDPRKTIESNEHQTRKPYSISLAVPTDS